MIDKCSGTVLLVVCLYEQNFGDILIYRTIADALARAGFHTETIAINEKIADSRFVERANSSDFVYFVGGGIIEKWAPEIIARFDSIFPQLTTAYGVVGLSTGSFDYSRYNKSLKVFADNAAFFFTRDDESTATFRNARSVCPPLPGVDVVFANNEVAACKANRSGVKASFRNVPYPDITGDLDWSAWAQALKRVGVVSLIPDCSNNQTAMGIPVAGQDILTEVASCRILITMRFHLVLAAAMTGALPIPICYCPKVTRLAYQLGISEYCLSIHDHDKLETTYNKLIANEMQVARKIANRVFQLRSLATAVLHQSIKLVEFEVNEKRRFQKR